MKNRSEASTFAGIPIPLTMETILDAMLTVHREMLFEFGKYASAQEIKESKRYRQLHAFRARILRMDAEKERDIRLLKEGNMTLAKLMVERVEAREKRIAMLDEHIAKLNGMLERLGVDMVTMELSDEA